MNTPEPLQALRRANRRRQPTFAQTVEAAAQAVHARIGAQPVPRTGRSRALRRAPRLSLAGLFLAAAAAAAVVLTLESRGGGPGFEDARTAAGSSSATPRASTRTAARPRPRISPPCVRTSAASRCGESPARSPG